MTISEAGFNLFKTKIDEQISVINKQIQSIRNLLPDEEIQPLQELQVYKIKINDQLSVISKQLQSVRNLLPDQKSSLSEEMRLYKIEVNNRLDLITRLMGTEIHGISHTNDIDNIQIATNEQIGLADVIHIKAIESNTELSHIQGTDTTLGDISATINMNGQLISNLANPISSQDAVTKKYIDDQLGNIIPRMTEAEINVVITSTTDLIVFNTTTNNLELWHGIDDRRIIV